MKSFAPSVVFFMLSFLNFSIWANPIDLSTFGADPGVTESGGVISFNEQDGYLATYFYDDYFSVPLDAVNLTYNYSLTLGDQNDDYLVAVIDFTTYEMETNTDGSGTWSIDLSSYQGQTISLAFGLESNDMIAGSSATISHLFINTASTSEPASVPEPSSLVLLCSGLLLLLGVRKKL